MITNEEKAIVKEISIVENRQRDLMKEINQILKSIPDVFAEGEESYPELHEKNNEMKSLINQRLQLLTSIGLEPAGPLPDNIEEHYLATLLG